MSAFPSNYLQTILLIRALIHNEEHNLDRPDVEEPVEPVSEIIVEKPKKGKKQKQEEVQEQQVLTTEVVEAARDSLVIGIK